MVSYRYVKVSKKHFSIEKRNGNGLWVECFSVKSIDEAEYLVANPNQIESFLKMARDSYVFVGVVFISVVVFIVSLILKN